MDTVLCLSGQDKNLANALRVFNTIEGYILLRKMPEKCLA